MRVKAAAIGATLVGLAACRDVGRAVLPPPASKRSGFTEGAQVRAPPLSGGRRDRLVNVVEAAPELGLRRATFEALPSEEGASRAARAAVNVPLHWESATGKVIGFVRRGAVVFGEVSHEARFVIAPFPRAPPDGVMTRDPPAQLGAWVSPRIADAEIPRDLVADRGAEIFYGLYRELSVEPGGAPFAFVQCGRVAVLERRGTSMRVAADYPSGELHGWLEAAAPGERDAGCDHPRGLPRGYAEFTGVSTAFQWLAARQGEVHWRTGSTCESWRFTATATGKKLVRTATPSSPRAERSYDVLDGLLWLGGTSLEVPRKGTLSSSGVELYRIADMNSEMLWALQVPSHDEAVVAYRVSALKAWFRTLHGCLAAAKRALGARGPG